VNPAIPPGYGARQAQPIESFFSQLDDRMQAIDLNNLRREAPQPTPADLDAMRAANAIFATPEGAVLLEWLADQTVRQPKVLPPIGTDPAQGWALAQRHEGQHDTFFLLVKLIAAAREEPAPLREGSPS
jgi:hypothetical protein